jgi:hypothetical protein
MWAQLSLYVLLTSLFAVLAVDLVNPQQLAEFTKYSFAEGSWLVASGLRVLAFHLAVAVAWRRMLNESTRYSAITIGLLLYSVASSFELASNSVPDYPLTMHQLLFQGSAIMLFFGLLRCPDRPGAQRPLRGC